MKACLMIAPGNVKVEEIEMPSIGSDQVLIEVKAAGICTNDIRDYLGDCDYSYPRIGGHEYVGVIHSMGSRVNTSRFHVGQKVVNYIIDDCKECYFCKTGNENICEDFPHSKVFHNEDGISGYCGFAQYVAADAKDLVGYEKQDSWERMALTEPLACVVNSVNRANIEFGQDVLVVGGGTMGLLHVMLAVSRGARVFLSEPMADRRNKALELGASDAFDPTSVNPIQTIKDLTGGRGADVVFDTVALPEIAGQAIEMTAPCGTCILFSSIHPNESIPVAINAVHAQQKTITGAESPTVHSFYQAVQLIDKEIIDPLPLVEKVFDYTDFQAAIDEAMRPDTYKVIVKFGMWE
ncbi:zinc-binding dehydrogenase [Olsenella sp. HMSC062G07]|uniref:zinc-dependent alcohol dehydrogenase n=1 Tax=Olsenella sp. HMSC062G07 TaxID=1739330 RepID=UPI0008A16C81|nr:zinc-binding dehydrogenase [Olsenella sp. HMSC062G07]OFK22422.1 alcohol dehydrogenase [Olsenella sp. HMSC062G07]